MSLLEEIEETKKQLAELEEGGEEQSTPEENDPEEKAEEAPEPEKPEPAPEPAKEDAEEKIRANEFYKMRRERDALQKRIQELEGKQTKADAPEPEQEAPEIQEVLEERRYEKAAEEFMDLERDIAKTLPDYEAITSGYKNAVYQSLRVLHPGKSQSVLVRETQREILRRAGSYYNRGLNPVEELYNEAKALGITAPKPVQQEEKKPTVDHDKLAANKARNAGTAGARGGSGGEVTAELAANYSPAEWAKLPKETKMRLLSGNAA